MPNPISAPISYLDITSTPDFSSGDFTISYYQGTRQHVVQVSTSDDRRFIEYTSPNIQLVQLFDSTLSDTVVDYVYREDSGTSTYTRTTNSNFFTFDSVSIEVVSVRDFPHLILPDKRREREERRARKALMKGVNLFKSLFGEQKIKSFLSGGSFTVEGEQYDYVISSKGNLIKHTMKPDSMHIPYNLEVVTKEGIIIGDGCTLFKNTPVIDQLIAFMLHIKENEQEVLDNMNITKRY